MKRFGVIFLILGVAFVSCEALLRLTGHLLMTRFYLEQLKVVADPGADKIILCLGESSTAGLGVAWKDSYPQQLRRMLTGHYRRKDIKVIVPLHVGQNTSQVANRVENYLRLYRPALVLLMSGANNEWSLAESHIGKFLNLGDPTSVKVRVLCLLDSLRIYKLLRYCYLNYLVKGDEEYVARNKLYIYGHPELARYPPKRWIHSFAVSHRSAFVELWKHDIGKIIDAALKRKIPVVLMTYPGPLRCLPAKEFEDMAARKGIPLVRNDLDFAPFFAEGTASQYFLLDRWHPNPKGYSIMAENVFRRIVADDLLKLD